MSCLPGMPCYNEVIYTNSQQGCGCCGISTCTGQCGCTTNAHCGVSSNDVTYVGPNLPNTGIQNLTDLTTAIEQLDTAIGTIAEVNGTSGTSGQNGPPGINGTSGSSGSSGQSGAAGSSGSSGSSGQSGAGDYAALGEGRISVGDILDRVRINVGGGDIYDSGSINIMYQ